MLHINNWHTRAHERDHVLVFYLSHALHSGVSLQAVMQPLEILLQLVGRATRIYKSKVHSVHLTSDTFTYSEATSELNHDRAVYPAVTELCLVGIRFPYKHTYLVFAVIRHLLSGVTLSWRSLYLSAVSKSCLYVTFEISDVFATTPSFTPQRVLHNDLSCSL